MSSQDGKTFLVAYQHLGSDIWEKLHIYWSSTNRKVYIFIDLAQGNVSNVAKFKC